MKCKIISKCNLNKQLLSTYQMVNKRSSPIFAQLAPPCSFSSAGNAILRVAGYWSGTVLYSVIVDLFWISQFTQRVFGSRMVHTSIERVREKQRDIGITNSEKRQYSEDQPHLFTLMTMVLDTGLNFWWISPCPCPWYCGLNPGPCSC